MYTGPLGADDAKFDAVLFDLLSALIDSWSLWDDIAGSRDAGRRWRIRYLELTYAAGAYRPYEDLVVESATSSGLAASAGAALSDRWLELEPWPEAIETLTELSTRLPLGVVTNCSIELGTQAAALLGVKFKTITTAEAVGFYKPLPAPYEAAVAALGTDPARTLFVAGSPGDIGGASRAGMSVVWHNRIGLSPPQGSPEPVAIVNRLDPLLGLLG